MTIKAETRDWLRDLVVKSNNTKAIEIREHINELEDKIEQVKSIIFDSGGPLNDDILGYTHQQLSPFAQIAELIDDQE